MSLPTPTPGRYALCLSGSLRSFNEVRDNFARLGGGGISSNGGAIFLTNGTKVYDNEAGQTASQIQVFGEVYYALPTPPGHWLPNAECTASRVGHMCATGLGSLDSRLPAASPPHALSPGR